MSTGLTQQELQYLQWICNDAWQDASKAHDDEGARLCRSISNKVTDGSISLAQALVDTFEFVDLYALNPLDMGTF